MQTCFSLLPDYQADSQKPFHSHSSFESITPISTKTATHSNPAHSRRSQGWDKNLLSETTGCHRYKTIFEDRDQHNKWLLQNLQLRELELFEDQYFLESERKNTISSRESFWDIIVCGLTPCCAIDIQVVWTRQQNWIRSCEWRGSSRDRSWKP